MKDRESDNLISEYVGRLAIKALDESVLKQTPRDSEGKLDPFTLNTEFGSGSGLMSQFATAIRLDKTIQRIGEIEQQANDSKIELPKKI